MSRVQVMQEADAVVLASGTLSPVASLTRQLFPTLDPACITHFACGHVVPKERLLALAIPQVRIRAFIHETSIEFL